MNTTQDRKPLYVTTIDDAKFARVESYVYGPASFIVVFLFGGIYVVGILLAYAFGVMYL